MSPLPRPARLGEVLATAPWRRARAVRAREAAVFRAFAEALGEEESGRVRAVALRRGILYVEVESAARLHELAAFGQDACVARTNASLGTALVRGIRFRLAPSRDAGG